MDSKGFGMQMLKHKKNPLIRATFFGFLGFSEEEKGPKMTSMENIIFSTFFILIQPENFGLVKFYQKCVVQEIASLAKKFKSGKRRKL
jgi:hypothetical protein